METATEPMTWTVKDLCIQSKNMQKWPNMTKRYQNNQTIKELPETARELHLPQGTMGSWADSATCPTSDFHGCMPGAAAPDPWTVSSHTRTCRNSKFSGMSNFAPLSFWMRDLSKNESVCAIDCCMPKCSGQKSSKLQLPKCSVNSGVEILYIYCICYILLYSIFIFYYILLSSMIYYHILPYTTYIWLLHPVSYYCK